MFHSSLHGAMAQAAFVAGPGGPLGLEGRVPTLWPYALGVQACNYVIIRLWNIIKIQHHSTLLSFLNMETP